MKSAMHDELSRKAMEDYPSVVIGWVSELASLCKPDAIRAIRHSADVAPHCAAQNDK